VSTPTILIIGKSGQLGFELQRSLSVLGNVVALDRTEANLLQAESLRKIVRAHKPKAIFNAAAFTAVDLAEKEPEIAMSVNGYAPEVLAEEAKKLGALFVHYSTDYVFDGKGTRPYTETDVVSPLSSYGRSKLFGEQAIQACYSQHLILRTSWVFGVHGSNFLKTILRLLKERSELRIVGDQYGAPTAASLIADVSAHLLRQYLTSLKSDIPFSYGLYHLTASGHTTWHEYAQLIAHLAMNYDIPIKINPDQIESIPTSDYPLPAARPSNSRLNTSLLCNTFDLILPDYTSGIKQVFKLLNS
jgi:dTDP-4-dehydrorhamnose reductase